MTAARTKAYLSLLLAAAIWGAAGPVIKYTLNGIDPLPFLAYRFLVTGLVCIIFFASNKKYLRQLRKGFWWIFGYGFFGAFIGLTLLFMGLNKTGVLDLSLIGLMAPIVVIIGGVLIFKDHITKREKIGISLVLIGAIFTGFSPLLTNHMGKTVFTGNILLFIFLASDSISYFFSKETVKKGIDPAVVTNGGLLIGALGIIPLAIATTGTKEIVNQVMSLTLPYHLGVIYMGLFSGSLAYYLHIRGLKTVEISESALFAYLQPIFAIPLAILWLNEKINIYFLVGAVLVSTGILLAEYKRRRR